MNKKTETTSREYGHAIISIKKKSLLFDKLKKINQVWMSHGDHIEKAPKDFVVTSVSKKNIWLSN